MSDEDSGIEARMNLEDILRQANENIRLFTSEELSEHVRQKHFGQGVPIYYIDPTDPAQMVEEHADGTIVRTALPGAETR